MDERVDKVHENRVRRMAQRQGLMLRKSRRRDFRANDFGVYWLVDIQTNVIVNGERGGTLDDVETWLTSD